MSNPTLVWVTAARYLALAYFCWPGHAACKPGLVNRLLPLAPLVLHVHILQGTILVDGGVSLGFASSLSAMMALTVLLNSAAAWRYPLGALQSFVMVLAGLALILQGLMPHAQAPEAESPISGMHLLMAFGAYGTFTIAALHAALIDLAEKQLHKPVPPPLSSGAAATADAGKIAVSDDRVGLRDPDPDLGLRLPVFGSRPARTRNSSGQ